MHQRTKCGIYADGKFVFVSSSGIAFTDSPSNKWTFLDAEVIGLSLGSVGVVGGGIAYADGYIRLRKKYSSYRAK